MRISEVISYQASNRPIVLRALDTSDREAQADPETFNYYLKRAGHFDGSHITGVHITDDSSRMLHALQQDIPVSSRPGGDLGNGFYFSDAPQIWSNRSTDKFSFLHDLTLAQRQALAAALRSEIERTPRGYISDAERSEGLAAIDRFLRGDARPELLTMLSDQPFNIAFWKPAFLQAIGIPVSPQPEEVHVAVAGRFAEVDYNIGVKTAQELMSQGFDGAFTPSGFSTVPQFVVYKNPAIKQFGNWRVG